MAYNVTNGNVEYGILLMGENMNVFEGGRAEYTVIKSQGNLFVHDGGVAVYSEVGDKAGVGKIIVLSGGTASDINIKINGYLEGKGGTISSVTITCDMDWFPQEEMAGGLFRVEKSVVHDVKVNEYGTFEVGSGCRVFNTVVKGSVDYENKKNGGKVTVASESTLYHTVIEHGGSVTVNGKIVDSIVEKGGTLTVSGTAENTAVKAGGTFKLSGTHKGTLNIDFDATVNAEGGEINFSLVDRTTSDGFLINSMALITGGPKYSITVAADQAIGSYRLGKRAAGVDDKFDIYSEDDGGKTIHVGSVYSGKSIVDERIVDNERKVVLYTIVKNDNNELFLKISSVEPRLPKRPVADANITKATNKNVTVTATFCSDSKIKQYKVGNGAWKTYKSPIVMKNNGMVYFRAADSAGNWSLVNSFRVNNIDRTAPVISKITAVAQNSTAALNISFKPDNSGISHCEITCGKKKMTIYPSGNLSANLFANLTGLAIGRHTVSVVVYDLAGNKSRTKRLSFTVKDVTPPSKVATLYAPSVTNKYKGTFKWTAATDNSGKIAKYEIQVDNGKIYTSTKTSVSISKLTVGNHTYRVRAIDKDKNVGAWSAVKSFTVKDYTAPKISKLTATVKGYTATLKITASDNVKVAKYVISYGKKSQTVTSNTATLTGLAVGRVAVSVVAYDAAGNKSSAKKVNLTIKDVTPPSKVATLYAPTVTNKYKGTFKWTAATDNSGKIAKYQIQVDNGKIYTSSKTSVSISNLKVGKHTYRVRAIDKDKNVGAWSAVKSFTVKDYTAPKISRITATVKGYTATLKITATDNVKATKYVISYGKKSQTVTTNTATLTGLAVGKVAVSVVAYDAAGNKSTAKKINLTVKDVTPPSKVATLYAPSVTNKYKGTFKWTAATDNSGKIAKYEIQLDNGKIYTSTKTTLSVSNLKVGKHTYRVRAIDKNKNAGAWSAVKSFTVKDMTAPATVSLSAKVSGNNATLTWKKPKDNVGVTKYVLKYGNKSVTLSGSATKYVIYGLNKGTYKYSMVAYDAAGNASKAKTGKITIKQALTPAKAAEALYAADFAAPEALFAPQEDVLAYCNELKTAANLSDVSTLAADKKEERSLLAALS